MNAALVLDAEHASPYDGAELPPVQLHLWWGFRSFSCTKVMVGEKTETYNEKLVTKSSAFPSPFPASPFPVAAMETTGETPVEECREQETHPPEAQSWSSAPPQGESTAPPLAHALNPKPIRLSFPK